MSKFASKEFKPTAKSGPVKTTGTTVVNHAGGVGYNREVLSDLFVFAACNLVGEDTYYEAKGERDERFRELIHRATGTDPNWVARFVPYLRKELNMRSASVVVAVESALARLGRVKGLAVQDKVQYADGEVISIRKMIDSACQRPDEPAEVIAYWRSRTGSKAVPGGVQRGLADAVLRLYNERNALKYDGVNQPFRMADVISIVHPITDVLWQKELFDYLKDVRWKHDEVRVGSMLGMIQARQQLDAIELEERRKLLLENPAHLKDAGYTWESMSSLGKMDKAAWEAMIPNMGIMALVRNLRNFDEAGVSDQAAQVVIDKLMDPEQIAKSRMFPYRFLSAFDAAPSLRWGYALERAVQASAMNIPELPGRTLVLVDTSASMRGTVSAKSKMSHVQLGALIGATIAVKTGNAELVGFADGSFTHAIPKGTGILKTVESFQNRVGEVGHGTQMLDALKRHFKGHDRVIIVSDMQCFPYLGIGDYNHGYLWGRGNRLVTLDKIVPETVPLFGVNVAGYASTAVDTSKRNRFEIAGFSDKLFTLFGVLSRGQGADWPF